jgi:hypothetical protein
MEAGVIDGGAVAAEHGGGVRRRAAAGPLEAGHLAPVQADSNRTERRLTRLFENVCTLSR